MSGSVPTAETLALQPNVASPHYRLDGQIRVIENASVDNVAAAGSVWSSVDDMAKWMTMLLEGRTTDGRRLLKKETLEELFRPQTLVDADEFYPTQELTKPHRMTYGLGWFQQDYRGRAVDFHTGSIDGMVAIHGLIRDEGLGVYVLGNLDHAEVRHAIMLRVFDLYGDGPPRDWSAELLKLYSGLREEADSRADKVEAERVEGTTPSRSLEHYAGTYVDEIYGQLRVTKDGDGLRLYLGPGLQGTLHHWNFDVFRVRWDAAWRGKAFVSFALDRNGEVASVQMGATTFARKTE